MGAALAPVGAVLGGVSGLLGQQREGGKTGGNAFLDGGNSDGQIAALQGTFKNYVNGGMGNLEPYLDAGSATPIATTQVQSNPLLSKSFGQNGLLNSTGDQINTLSNQGFQLTPEDREAYAQVSSDIARQFDQGDQSLASALSARGLDSSGVAGKEFSDSMGSKNEQLQKAQMNLAQNRYNQTLSRLNSARQFYGNLQGQSQEALNSQRGANLADVQMYNNENARKATMAQSMLGNIQNQQNANIGIEQNTQHESPLSSGFNGAVGGFLSGANLAGAMGPGGSGNKVGALSSAGGSYSNGGALA